MAVELEIIGSKPVVTGVLFASAAIALLVILGAAPGGVLWIAIVAAIVVTLAELALIIRSKLAI